ncbi:MAG: hypothetical protein QOH03_4338 [Kribbellaceae bacterium]|jgi:hypothetical protein|nr:hypothetical protein [Kribbellaceae bacterium]
MDHCDRAGRVLENAPDDRPEKYDRQVRAMVSTHDDDLGVDSIGGVQ